MKILHPSYCIECKFENVSDYLETLQNDHPELVTFDLAELKVMLKLECILILVSHKDMV
jgi:hypothetical protein